MQQYDSTHAVDRFFSLRIVSLDYYLAPPIPGLDVTFSSLEGTAVDSVPVVRVFGATPAGQRVCLHLHQVMISSIIIWRHMLQPMRILTLVQGCMVSQQQQSLGSWKQAQLALCCSNTAEQAHISIGQAHTSALDVAVPRFAGLSLLLRALWQ